MRITAVMKSHKMNLLDIFNQLLPTTSVGNEYEQQMRIQILILGLKESKACSWKKNKKLYIINFLVIGAGPKHTCTILKTS